jgi:hypothetical protein
VQSFVESAVAAGLASLNEDGEIVLVPLEAGADPDHQPPEEQHLDNPPPAQPFTGRKQPVARQGTRVVHQVWAIDGGSIVFEILTDKPLPATAFATVGEVVASLEHLAETLTEVLAGGDEAEETEV